MDIGFIGAGKAGTALGRYLADNGEHLVGYASASYSSALRAAESTCSQAFPNVLELASKCELIFITTPDGAISSVWQELLEAHQDKLIDLGTKIIAHCSGCCSSELFTQAKEINTSVCSVHPLLAFGDIDHAHEQLADAHISVEGDKRALDVVVPLFERAGNCVHHLAVTDKVRYHAAAVFASNLVLAPLDSAVQLLESCGFSSDEAREALYPLIANNISNFRQMGACAALTGPVERNDKGTVIDHLSVLSDSEKQLYCALTRKLIELAQRRHPDRSYEDWNFL